MAVILETSLGDITIDLYTEERPRCSLNFLKLCKIKYYNFCLFHSVQRNLVAQTGDPTGTGKGGQSIYSKLYGEQAAFFEPEYKPRIKHKKLGTVSMVNNGKTLHGSQFFITTGSDLDYLDGVHTVFGEVSEGHDVLQKINESITDEEHRPYQDIRIFHTVVLDDPYDDSPEIAECIPDRSPEPTKEQLTSNRIGVDEDVDAMDGKSAEEMAKILSEREAKANAQILEMVGDLPDADVAPEDNVLFVCKLNPVTTEDDLEIIFSRFGAIKGCEVIKDKKTGESLQYAFIEFTKVADCENAYFKMDNVIIDDRRIHVDFSQSVAKVKWKNKGKGEKQDDGEKDKPSFIIKDKSRRDDRYSLVFSDEEEGGSKVGKKKHKKKKKKHKKQKDSSSESSDNEQTTHRGKRKDRVTSRSPSPAQKKHHTDRQKQTRRSSDGDRKTDKDRTRDRSVDRDRSPDQEKTVDRERTRERSHDHARHKGKDRDRDKRDDKYDDRSRNRDRNRNKDRPRDGDRKRDRY